MWQDFACALLGACAGLPGYAGRTGGVWLAVSTVVCLSTIPLAARRPPPPNLTDALHLPSHGVAFKPDSSAGAGAAMVWLKLFHPCQGVSAHPCTALLRASRVCLDAASTPSSCRASSAQRLAAPCMSPGLQVPCALRRLRHSVAQLGCVLFVCRDGAAPCRASEAVPGYLPAVSTDTAAVQPTRKWALFVCALSICGSTCGWQPHSCSTILIIILQPHGAQVRRDALGTGTMPSPAS